MGNGAGSPVPELYGRIAKRFGELIRDCPRDRWGNPSPCPGWTAWDVAAHVVSNHRRALAGLDGSGHSAPVRGEDLARAWRAASGGIEAALGDPVQAGARLGEEFGSLPFEEFVRRMACADTLVHGWDLARATGQDEALDSEAVAVASRMLLPEDGDIRMPGAFGAKISPAADADAQTRLLNFLGRTV
ncbi:TIGR03086 family metal-binding protein [Streptomyces genisteinicus]|uniref:TIGR03086 family protein n=1 Tax=Streptomyces genisteinicus TaxID=2768068 RepID=A0A7H0I4T8_9ACTN|nr:TIGR03086 family metal-binding protein [Streptomyces genisteinicus]QNP67804.1 TIGR03086 family protein [Streptomyces genisteinicus]